MSVTNIPESVKLRLWGKAAGRCEYEGCNQPLWLDSLTKCEFNTAYIAHIIADSPDGPRGHPTLSKQLAADISNLMLLCDEHHRLIDKVDLPGHPVERLRKMKEAHERRIEIAAGITTDKSSHILLYGANVGELTSPVSYAKAAQAIFPERYPAETRPFSLGMQNSSFRDDMPEFWQIESEHLRRQFEAVVRPRVANGDVQHLSVFAVGPQPLLILLGCLLSDLVIAEVYQLHREPPDWRWQEDVADFDYVVSRPSEVKGTPVLVLSLSASIANERISTVIGADVSIWTVTINAPHNDFLKSRRQLAKFRETARKLMVEIAKVHGQKTTLAIFPAMPISCAVELGRIRMPKADMPWVIYDQNNKLGKFVKAITIGASDEQQNISPEH